MENEMNPPERVLPIVDQLLLMNKSMNMLDGRVKELVRRLELVMAPQPPSKVPEPAQENGSSDMYSELKELCTHLDFIDGLVLDILNRLEF